MTIVLDTNVLVSGLLKPYSSPAAILRLVVEGTVQLAYDLRILSEYLEVLKRPKFGFEKEGVDWFLALVEQEGLLVVGEPLKFHLPDPDDEPFLEVALSAKAAALVTGNKRHFPRRFFARVKILSPPEFLETYRK
jgi:putative PIN family toxin of toxin-antitoxin system